jgi:hypothetical protein
MFFQEGVGVEEVFRDFDIKVALILFFAYILVDGLYAYYTLSVIKLRPLASASTSFLMHFILAFGVLNYVNNFLYIIPLAVGSFLGTYILVYTERKSTYEKTLYKKS